MSKNTAAVEIMVLKFRVTWSLSVVLWRARSPNWFAFSMLLTTRWLCFSFWITFLKSLPVVDRSLIGRKFWGNFESLPCFGKAVTFVSFQAAGTYESLKQWLNKWVRWTSGLLGKCLRHSLGISSSPQAFYNFRVRIISCTSQGLTFSV
jgi:hypothetical protein